VSIGERVINQHELEQAMEVFAGLSENLSTSFTALAQRAEHVERELCQANEDLASKVSELDALQRHLESILQALPTGVVVRDAAGRITRANEAATSILGRDLAALVGEQALPGLEHPHQDTSTTYTRPDGETRTIARRRSNLPAPDGEDAGSVEILDDRTELQRLTERLHALDKMAALGSMAGGIAHEIRNPMNAIQGFAELMAARFADNTQESRWCSLIVEGSREVEGIIQSLLTLADPKRLHVDRVSASGLLREATDAALRALPEASVSRWTITQTSDLDYLYVDRIQVRQALRNLIANSIQAQSAGGTVDVRVHAEGAEAVITVTDSGPGIPADLAERIGDPFFTTRAEGTGLGLALVNSIAQLHGGHLHVHATAPGQRGAHVSLHFPLPGEPNKN
jgi:two-component system sensor histidine kinase FlrB